MQFIWGLGVSERAVQFCDVYGLDDELIALVPHPVLAVLFLYPFTSLVSNAFGCLDHPIGCCVQWCASLAFVYVTPKRGLMDSSSDQDEENKEESSVSATSTAGGKVWLYYPLMFFFMSCDCNL